VKESVNGGLRSTRTEQADPFEHETFAKGRIRPVFPGAAGAEAGFRSRRTFFKDLRFSKKKFIVPFWEWEKNPRLQAKTLVCPQGQKRTTTD